MHRREFITLLGGAAAAWPLAARAQQQPAMPVIGYLYSGSPETSAHLVAAFRRGLGETGFVEGGNVAIEFRWAHNDFSRLPELAADLVRRRVAVIAAPGSGPAALAARNATPTIPVIFMIGADPVELGLVASLNRPGGNLTGFSGFVLEVTTKRLGLLHELVAKTGRFAQLVDPTAPTAESQAAIARAAAATLGGQMEVFTASTNQEIDTAFANLVQKGAEAVLVGTHPLYRNRRVQLVNLAAHYRLPAIYFAREFAEIGGLMSYGGSLTDVMRQVGIYTGRILKGEKPADLPVQRGTKFEFVINLQTARTLGIEVPPLLLAIADEVIQ